METTQQAGKPIGQHIVLTSHHLCKAVWGDVHIISVLSVLFTGKRFSGEGERENVRAVWRNATINAEAF